MTKLCRNNFSIKHKRFPGESFATWYVFTSAKYHYTAIIETTYRLHAGGICLKINTINIEAQNFKNHARYVPSYHFVLSGIFVVILILSLINIFSAVNLLSVMFVLMAIAFLIIFLKMRSFPLAAQDRAIRAEENLRYFSLTGKLADRGLPMSQIVALRFADDNEFVDLAEKALNGNMSNKEIKQAIENWRADNHRA